MKVKLLYKKIGEDVKFVEVSERNLLEEVYKLIDVEYVESFQFTDVFTQIHYVILLDETGKFKDKPVNTTLVINFVPFDTINGDFCIGKVEGSEIVSVNEEELEALVKLLNKDVSILPTL